MHLCYAHLTEPTGIFKAPFQPGRMQVLPSVCSLKIGYFFGKAVDLTAFAGGDHLLKK